VGGHRVPGSFDVLEFAVAAGVTPEWLFRRDGKPSGGIPAGIRRDTTSPKERYREQVSAEEFDSWGEGATRDFFRD
jgi:hypothetical protein